MRRPLSLLFVCACAYAYAGPSPVTCAISVGYPPYQYEKEGRPAGIDAEIVELHNRRAKSKIRLVALNWDEAMSKLYYSKDLDCLWGMELDPKRKKRFSHTSTLYTRRSSLFIKAKNKKNFEVSALKGKTIVGDKDSALEKELRRDYPWIRIRHVETKDQAMQALKEDEVYGAIMPKRVGQYLARRKGFDVKIVKQAAEKTPVVVAVKKGNQSLLNEIKEGLKEMPQSDVDRILNKVR